jgi:hypothetical protein
MRPRTSYGVPQLGCAAQLFRFVMEAEILGHARDSRFCREHICLHLTERNGPFGELAVGMKDRIMGVFPSLLRKSAFCLARIFNNSIPIDIAKGIDPVECHFDIRPKALQELYVSSPVIISTGKHEKQWRRVHTAVIPAERHLS